MSLIELHDGKVQLHGNDCREVLKSLDDDSTECVVCDPPYALVSIQKRFGKEGSAPTKDGDVYSRSSAGFMGKQWDTGETAFAVEFWEQVFRVLKPGGHVIAFSGTRTYHRMTCAIEDAGFEIRDQLAWVYGSGFPKSHDISKQMLKNPKIKGTSAVDWEGWGTALKPCWEPICLARKPVSGTIADNVLGYGTGAINIDECRVGDEARYNPSASSNEIYGQFEGKEVDGRFTNGRWPTNILHDGSSDVMDAFPDETQRFFYCAKAWKEDREEGLSEFDFSKVNDGRNAPVDNPYQRGETSRLNTHPTVKPTELMRWLCRLVCPKGGTVLDPFMGSGSTGKAAVLEGFNFIGCEREEEYIPISRARIKWTIENLDVLKRGLKPIKPDNDNNQTQLAI